MQPAILKMNFPVGVSLKPVAWAHGVSSTRGIQAKRFTDAVLRKVYEVETGRDPLKRHEGGLARAQWEYGVRGTDFYAKDKRAAVLAYSERAA